MNIRRLGEQARELVKCKPEWHPYGFEVLRREPAPIYKVTGAECPLYIRGPRKGQPNLPMRKPGTVQEVLISEAEHLAWLQAWEERTGKCWVCEGSGKEWCGWSADDGSRYRPCSQCESTGRPSMSLSSQPSVAGR